MSGAVTAEFDRRHRPHVVNLVYQPSTGQARNPRREPRVHWIGGGGDHHVRPKLFRNGRGRKPSFADELRPAQNAPEPIPRVGLGSDESERHAVNDLLLAVFGYIRIAPAQVTVAASYQRDVMSLPLPSRCHRVRPVLHTQRRTPVVVVYIDNAHITTPVPACVHSARVLGKWLDVPPAVMNQTSYCPSWPLPGP